jgi:hypothetical protein
VARAGFVDSICGISGVDETLKPKPSVADVVRGGWERSGVDMLAPRVVLVLLDILLVIGHHKHRALVVAREVAVPVALRLARHEPPLPREIIDRDAKVHLI